MDHSKKCYFKTDSTNDLFSGIIKESNANPAAPTKQMGSKYSSIPSV